MMTLISDRARLKLDYVQLDHLGYWEGNCYVEDQLYYRGDHVLRAYADVLGTADWDNLDAPRYNLSQQSHLYL